MLTTEQQTYIDNCKAELEDILSFGKRTENTISAYKTYALPFLAFCFETLGKSPANANEADARAYLRKIQAERDLSDRTLDLARSSMRFLFSAILDLPWNALKVPYLSFDEYVAFVPTTEEIEAFLSAAERPISKAVFAIMYATGARVSEICRLRYGDISKTDSYIRIAPSKRRKEHLVQMPDACFHAIQQYGFSLPREVRRSLTVDSFLFPSSRSREKCCSGQFVRNEIRRIEKKLGWEHRFGCHTFRRAFATHNYIAGNLTLEELQLALDHKNQATTKIYLKSGMMYLAEHHPNTIDRMKF